MTTIYRELELEVDWHIESEPVPFTGSPWGHRESPEMCIDAVIYNGHDIMAMLSDHELRGIAEDCWQEVEREAREAL